MTSLPSRGAWIEIFYSIKTRPRRFASLPSRGAWIEIILPARGAAAPGVAPLAGSVDRNEFFSLALHDVIGRSPRGERG